MASLPVIVLSVISVPTVHHNMKKGHDIF